MAPTTNIFFTGATGYIGGAVLTRLLAHPDAASFNITTLVRSPEKAEKLKAFGVTPAVGSHDDSELLERLAANADVVFAVADADHVGAAKAILRGLKTRHAATGKKPILIHTSGTGVLADNAAGAYSTDVIYNDADADQIAGLPESRLHRNVDLLVEAADTDGYARTHIILPSTIYGIATGALFDAGIANPHSIQVPALIRAGVARRQGGVVGAGKNRWPNVDIDEVADLYIDLYNAIVANPGGTGHGHDGYYFGASGEHLLYDVSKEIARVLASKGLGAAEPTTFTPDELQKYFGGSYLGSNSRCVAEHSRAIGWKPVKSTKDLLASITPEVEAVLAKST